MDVLSCTTYRFLQITFGYCQIMSDSHFLGTLLYVAFHQLKWRILARSVRRKWPYWSFSSQIQFDGLSSDVVTTICES
jgi:hypothetical protein